ncbi:MAG: FAD-binding oxidoreductase [Planctomycetota bacterium]
MSSKSLRLDGKTSAAQIPDVPARLIQKKPGISAPADPVVAELRIALGDDAVAADRDTLVAYECDGLALYKQKPRVVVLPRSTEQVAAAVRILHKYQVPMVARGAGTGLSGGATPVEGGAIIHLSRMRRILEIDSVDRLAHVELGLINADLSQKTARHGLAYAPDPSSQTACTLGGNVAENAGGPHCFKYGATTLHVVGLKVVLSNGDICEIGGPELDPIGYDLRTLFIGSEGTLGIATEAWLKLVPKPEMIETLLAPFPTMDAACRTVSAIVATGIFPAAIEILDDRTIAAIEASVFAAGYPKDAAAVLLVEVDGSPIEVERDGGRIREICKEHGALNIQFARDEEDRKRLWKGRKGAFGAMGRVAPDLYVMDCGVPRSRLPEALDAIRNICDRLQVRNANVFHAGDGNLHPNISYDGRDGDELKRVLLAGEEIVKVCVSLGGTLSGEHGIGIEKNSYMPLIFSEADFAAFLSLRRAFDPNGLMNPGKLLPSHVCGEIAAGRKH